MKRVAFAIGLAVACAWAAKAQATCWTWFDSSLALFRYPDQARANFANGPYVEFCGNIDNNTDTVNLNVAPVEWTHFHLGFDDNRMNQPCGFCDPNDGKGSGFNDAIWSGFGYWCTTASPPCPDWGHMGRVALAHDGASTLHFTTTRRSNGALRWFILDQVSVGPGPAATVWIRDTLGNWYNYSNLTQNTTWTLDGSPFAIEAYWGTTAGTGAPATLNGFHMIH